MKDSSAGVADATNPTLTGVSASTGQPLIQTAEDAEQIQDMKMVMMDSAELASRAAGLAANAGGELRNASKDLFASYEKHRKFFIILLTVSICLMLIAGGVFAALSWRLQSRLAQLDAMVLAVGKRVVGMDASMESVGAVQEALQDMLGKLEAVSVLQAKIDGRLEEVIKSTQGVPELTAQQVGGKTQAMTEQVKSLDGRLQVQAKALTTLSTQMKGLQGALGDTGAVRKEMEIQARQQRERQAQDAALNAANAAALRNRDRMLQYPRTPPAEKP